MQPAAVRVVTTKLREGVAHDAAAAREAACAQFAPDLLGIAAAVGGPGGQVLSVSVKQTWDSGTTRTFGKRVGMHEAGHGTAVKLHRTADCLERLASLMPAYGLFVARQAAFSMRVAAALRSPGWRLGWHGLLRPWGAINRVSFEVKRFAGLSGGFFYLAWAAQQQPLNDVVEVRSSC